MPDVMELVNFRKAITIESLETKDVNGKWIVEGFASTDAIDHTEDRVTLEGLKSLADSLESQQTVLFNHDSNRPIGRLLDRQVREIASGMHGLWVKIQISPSEPGVWQKIKDGTISKFSWAGQVRDAEDLTDEKTGRRIRHLKNIKGFEVSLVSIPANNTAEVTDVRVGKGIGLKGDVKLIPESDDPITGKAVVPYKNYGQAPMDTAWNGSFAVRDADAAALRKMSAIVVGEADAKASYKLPHHRPSDIKAVWNGVRAAMGALLGARGGVDATDADKRGAYSHLVKHYAEFEKEAPKFKSYTETELKEAMGEDILAVVEKYINCKESEMDEILKKLAAGQELTNEEKAVLAKTAGIATAPEKEKTDGDGGDAAASKSTPAQAQSEAPATKTEVAPAAAPVDAAKAANSPAKEGDKTEGAVAKTAVVETPAEDKKGDDVLDRIKTLEDAIAQLVSKLDSLPMRKSVIGEMDENKTSENQDEADFKKLRPREKLEVISRKRFGQGK